MLLLLRITSYHLSRIQSHGVQRQTLFLHYLNLVVLGRFIQRISTQAAHMLPSLQAAYVCAYWVPGTEATLIAPGRIQTRYWLFGPETGRKVVLIHGLSVPSLIWKHIAPELAKKGMRVLVYGQFQYYVLRSSRHILTNVSRSLWSRILRCATSTYSTRYRPVYCSVSATYAAHPMGCRRRFYHWDIYGMIALVLVFFALWLMRL